MDMYQKLAEDEREIRAHLEDYCRAGLAQEDREMAELAPNGKAKVTVELVGQDGNAFSILGRCSKAMRRAGWGTTEIRDFQAEATSGDYSNLLATVMDYCEDASEEEEDEEYQEGEDA